MADERSESKTDGARWADFVAAMPVAERKAIHDAEHAQAKAEHDEFEAKFKAGDCFLCGETLASFNEKAPCAHWLLKPHGFRGRHLLPVTQRHSMFELQSYLRWVANQDGFARNITDTSGPDGGGKLVEITIRYLQLEWSISCGAGDFAGHPNSKAATMPHYHFQMRVQGRPFINYNDNHIPLKRRDVLCLEAMQSAPHAVRPRFSFGEGMREVFAATSPEEIVHMTVPGDKAMNEAHFSIDTLLMAEEGHAIKGDDLYALIQEARAKNVTLASLADKVPNATSRIVVSPGPGVVDPAPRAPRKR